MMSMCNTPEFPTAYTKPKPQRMGGNLGVTLKIKINKIIINLINLSRNFDSISTKNKKCDKTNNIIKKWTNLRHHCP